MGTGEVTPDRSQATTITAVARSVDDSGAVQAARAGEAEAEAAASRASRAGTDGDVAPELGVDG